jgi:hypothetical protein
MGEFNGISSLASGLTSGLTCVVKICEFTYALKAVSEQTFAYLQTTEHVSENIKTAQRLRQQRANFLPAEEKRDMDRVIRETETAVRCVAKLLEPARVDREAEQKIRFSTRGLWVLRDNPNIAAALNRLQIAHSALNQVIGSLRASQNIDGLSPSQAAQSGPPPPYRSGSLLHWRMQSRLNPHKDGVQTPKNEGLGIRDVPNVTVEEIPPTPVPPPQQSSMPSSTVPSASQNQAQYSERSFFPDSSRDEEPAVSCYSAPQPQKPFHETFFSAGQPWHHPPDTFFSEADGYSTCPEVISSTTAARPQHVPESFYEVFAGLETVDPNALPPLTQVQSHKTWLSYQASRSGRRRRPERYSLP